MKKMLKLMLTASVSAVVMLASCTEGDFPPPRHLLRKTLLFR
jgi:hypothetical protein